MIFELSTPLKLNFLELIILLVHLSTSAENFCYIADLTFCVQ